MRRAFVVLVLLAMMVGVKTLKKGTESGVDPLILGAIGFVVLAAFAIAEIGARLSLPKITGYIVTGVVVGPYALGILSGGVVGELTMFSKLALGLIAITAGLELDLGSLRSQAKTLTATVAIKLLTGFLLVGSTVLAGEVYFSFLGLGDAGSTMALALVFAALSVGTSPSISVAILTETRAKGRLSDLVLGAAVVKDVVVVVLLAVVVAVAGTLLPPTHDGVAADVSPTAVMLEVGRELGGSLLAGGLLAGLLVLYLRYVRAEMVLFVAAMVLVVAELAGVLHLEILLVFIFAGVVVRNFSRYGHELLHPLETISLPVFIVFFTNAGASVDLGAAAEVFPLALSICVVRVLGYIVASRVGGKLGGEPAPIRNLAWLGYFPQAGVTLGLVGLAASQIPQLSSSIMTLGMAVVAINLLLGPITLRFALHRAGEIEGTSDPVVAGASADVQTEPPDAAWGRLEAETLRDIAKNVHFTTSADLSSLVDNEIEPWTRRRAARLNMRLAEAANMGEAYEVIADVLDRLPPDDAPQRVDRVFDSWTRACGRLEAIPEEVTVPLEREWQRSAPGDSPGVVFRKVMARVGDALRFRFRRRTRSLPARMVARVVVEPSLARGLEEVVNEWYRVEARMLEELRRCALGTVEPAQASRAIHEHAELFVQRARVDLQATVDDGLRRFVRDLARVGSPVWPASRIRYSRVEPALAQWRERMRDDARSWGSRRGAGVSLVRVTVEVGVVDLRLGQHLKEHVYGVAEEAFAAVLEEIEAEQRRLAQIVERTRALPAFDDEAVERLNVELSALLPRPVHKRLRAVGGRLRRATSGASLDNFFQDTSISRIGRETLVPSMSEIADGPRPAQATVVTLDVGETIQGYLSGELAPRIEQIMGELWSTFAFAREAMGNCEGAAEFTVTSTFRNNGEEFPEPEVIASQLAAAMVPLVSAGESTASRWKELEERLPRILEGTETHVAEAIESAAGRSLKSVAGEGGVRLGRAASQFYDRFARPLVGRIQEVLALARGEAAQNLGRQVRLRSGAQVADAADVRELVNAGQASGVGELPQIYRALFAPDPIRDPRLFAAHRAELQDVTRAERAWQQDSANGNAVLVVGNVGTGKSSLIHVARLKLATRRVIVVPDRSRAEESALSAFLARELGCEPHVSSIATALARAQTAIVIDDLHQWLPTGTAGLAALEEVLSLVLRTRESTFWMVSLPAEWLEGVEKLVQVRQVFAQIVDLSALDADELDAVVRARQQLSGFELMFPAGWRTRALGRLLRRSPREVYLRSLLSSTRGNPRKTLRTWLRRAKVGEERTIELAPVGIEWGLPLHNQLTATQLAVLGLLLREGQRVPEELSAALSLPPSQVSRGLHFLAAAGLIMEQGDYVRLRDELVDDIAATLADLGAIWGGPR